LTFTPGGKTRKGEESKARLLAEAGRAQGAFYLYFPSKEAGHHRPDLPVETAADCMADAIERITRTRLLTGQASPATLAAEVTDLLLHGLLA
jgi:AcrR family transcriptional regulator